MITEILEELLYRIESYCVGGCLVLVTLLDGSPIFILLGELLGACHIA